MEYIFPISLATLMIGSLIAVKVQLAKKPSYKDANKMYQDKKVCEEIHKSVSEKLECIPDIKKTVTQIETKIDIFLERNGK